MRWLQRAALELICVGIVFMFVLRRFKLRRCKIVRVEVNISCHCRANECQGLQIYLHCRPTVDNSVIKPQLLHTL